MVDNQPPRWIVWMVHWRWLLAAIGLVLGLLGAAAGQRLALDRSIENMFAPDDPILASYRQQQRTFGKHDVVLAVYSDPQLKSPAGVQRLQQLRDKLKAVPGVVSALSLADLPQGTAFDDRGAGDAVRDVFAGYTHNRDLTAAGVICLTQRGADAQRPRREIIGDLRAIITQPEYANGALVGEPVMIEEAFDLLDADGKRLNLWSTTLVMLVIVACFRSLRWLVLPLAVVQLALQTTRGLLVVSGLQLSMVSSMLAAIITVCGVAMVVHIMVHYLDVRRAGVGRRQALIQTIDELAVPVTWAILTDAAGFAALMVSSVGPIHDFGLMMAIGSAMTLPACALLLPALILVGDSSKLPPPEKHGALTAALSRMLGWSNTHAGTLVVAASVIAIVSIVGAQRLVRETAFTNNFRKGTPIIRAYDFVEDQFGGAGVWGLMAPMPKSLNGKKLADVMQLERDLQSQSPGEITKAISLADAMAARMGGPTVLKNTPALGLQFGLQFVRGRMPEFTESWYATDPETGKQWIQVLLRSPERLDADRKLALIDRVQTEAAQRFPGARTTGYYVLLADLIESVLDDQWKTFAVASLAVFLMTLAAFRNFPLALATMIPNAIPVLIVFGGMGWLGIKTNMGAAMIAAVSVGLSIDSSIHYVMLYQHHRRKGMSLDEALALSQDSAGRAATLSTLALIVGFATLCVSDFIPTIYFGALVSLSMIGGLIGNLLVQPMLIRKLDWRRYGNDQAAA